MRRTLMPCASAACWSSATARMAMPSRERWKKSVNPTSATATTPIAHSRFWATVGAEDARPSPTGMKSGNGRGSRAPDDLHDRAEDAPRARSSP